MNLEAETIDAKTIVELIRAQNWQNGVLLVEEADAVRLVATALRVAEDRGIIGGMERMSAIVDSLRARRNAKLAGGRLDRAQPARRAFTESCCSPESEAALQRAPSSSASGICAGAT
jgi:hypothetical protein